MPIQRSYCPIFIFVALGKVAGRIDGVDSEILRKKLHDFLYPCIMRTIEYQSHLEQNFAHYTREITVNSMNKDFLPKLSLVWYCF